MRMRNHRHTSPRTWSAVAGARAARRTVAEELIVNPVWPDNDGWFPRAAGGLPADGDGLPGEQRHWVDDEVMDAEDFLTNLIAEEMIRDPDVRSGQMLVMVQNGVVILQGYVDTDDSRSAAVRRAWATPGVFDVCNLLTVGPDGHL
jgi:BON domain